MIRVGNAPLSYGAFEMTVGIFPNVPGPDEVVKAIAYAGYEGTELGPPGYLGEGKELHERLERHGLELTGGWCPVRFSEPPGTVVENPFLIVRVRERDTEWRVLARVRVTAGHDGEPVAGDSVALTIDRVGDA